MRDQHFDCLAVGVVDFSKHSFKNFELCEPDSFFDLASLTKPLTLGLVYSLDPNLFDKNQKLLLEHRASLPAWGRLSHFNWREQISSYPISESETLYSDFSALRSMIEWEKKSQKSLYETCSEVWDDEVCSWLSLEQRLDAFSPVTGYRKGELISGQVHDDNAFVIGERVSHAGLFGTIKGLCQTLLNWNQKCQLLEIMQENISKAPQEQRFVCGWDRVLEPENSLAGLGCGKFTFGHLGFTGTSIWIDPELKKGHIILTNATRNYWYDRAGLTRLRKELGKLIWAS